MDRYYLALLHNMEKLSTKKLAFLLKVFGDAKSVWTAELDDLLSCGLDDKTARSLCLSKTKKDPEELFELCNKNAFSVITYYDDNYPKNLLSTGQAPLVLFIKGSLPETDDKIAIVGSRKATSYGSNVTKMFAGDLAKAGFVIVSGGAKGIDTEAHEGAIAQKGKTIAVFGCGLDVYYPKENKHLFEQIVDFGGCLVSEYLPKEQPIAWHFPARNRIISGLSRGVLVVEANEKSGSLLTANFALETGREVYCIPGSIYSASSRGVHNLIKQGASLVDKPDDILSDLGFCFLKPKAADVQQPVSFTDEEKAVYDSLIVGRDVSVDEIIENTGLDQIKVAIVLLDLEISGFVKSNAGLYQRIERGHI